MIEKLHDDEVRCYCAKEYMEYVSGIRRRIDVLNAEIESITGISGVDYSCQSVSASACGDALERVAISVMDLAEQLETESVEYREQYKIAHDAVGELKHIEAEALSRHYLCGESWEQCCVSMGYTWQGMMKLRRRALISLYDFLPEDWKSIPIPNAIV